MGIGELVLIALVGLALFGGTINIQFKGVLRRAEEREPKDGTQEPRRKSVRGAAKKLIK
jgi:hypothetical protein